MTSVPISAIVLTANEAASVDACLASLAWADERLVVDSFSADGTAQRTTAASRILQRRFRDYADQRQHAMTQAAHDWVLFVDPDERVTADLAAEIRRRAGREAFAGYWIPRRNRILGRWMRASGWFPDPQLRLMDRRASRFRADRPVHELASVNGALGNLAGSLEHYSYRSVAEFRRRQRRYAAFEARAQFERGVRRRRGAVLAQPLREFVRRFVRYRGYRDGAIGLLLAVLMAEYEWCVQRRLRRLHASGHAAAGQP